MHFITFCVLFVLKCTLSVQQQCGSSNSDSEKTDCNQQNEHEKQKYKAPKWQKYLDLISQAEQDYAPCTRDSSDCSTCHDDVIHQDLAPFLAVGGITRDMMAVAANVSRVTKYQIIGNKLYRSEQCMFPFRCKGIEHFLKEILPDLPDTEFYLNTRDWPMAARYISKDPVAVFSFSKTPDYWDIMYPAWTFWEGGPALDIYPTGLGRWDKYVKSLTAEAIKFPWHLKDNKGFFRGSRTSAERDPLVLLSRDSPTLLDAQYTKNQAWRSEKDTLGAQPAKEVTLEEHCRYKYLFNYRGVAASFRFKHLFLCGSLVIHVGDQWQEFFYPALKPWLHYIPLPNAPKAGQEEIREVLQFARENDAVVQKIAARGSEFIAEHLKFKDISCYWKKLLMNYAALLNYKVEKDAALFEI
eukprot:TRINITY_DN12730_c0_g1_i3.p1 TRINITY_DN12730_c0_g1~~TRINITY_DN12730_c0_g1_i3.p1  ORF type:complete len:411 (+),score=73.39 TRINITY_DN12730_c0_g1_i3:47-1279(+)